MRRLSDFPNWLPWVAGSALLFVLGARGLHSVGRNYWELRDAGKELASLELESDQLDIQLVRIKGDKEYLERIARRDLGMMKAGEIEYRFDPPK